MAIKSNKPMSDIELKHYFETVCATILSSDNKYLLAKAYDELFGKFKFYVAREFEYTMVSTLNSVISKILNDADLNNKLDDKYKPFEKLIGFINGNIRKEARKNPADAIKKSNMLKYVLMSKKCSDMRPAVKKFIENTLDISTVPI